MKTSIIICSYNEERTILDVVRSCCTFMPYAEVIVIDDGSTDNSSKILKDLQNSFSFVYKKLETNKGKSWALVEGIKASSNDLLLFFDADLYNIKEEHLTNLIEPLINKEADIVLGQISETFVDYRVNPFKMITGQRALFKKDILPILEDIREIRYGVETFINLYYQAQGKCFKYVLLEGLNHYTKFEKTTALKASKGFIDEGREIAFTLIQNRDLIHKRIQLLLDKKNHEALANVKELQYSINKRLFKLKTRFEELLKNKK